MLIHLFLICFPFIISKTDNFLCSPQYKCLPDSTTNICQIKETIEGFTTYSVKKMS